MVVGAKDESSAATGVNGDGSDNSATSAGAAYVFGRSGTVWAQQAYLKASNTDAGDRFGASVAVSGDRVVVGADGEASAATGVNSDQADNNAAGAGAAYVLSLAAQQPSLLYLPMVLDTRPLLVATISSDGVAPQPVATPGTVFYTTTLNLPAALPSGGTYFSRPARPIWSPAWLTTP